jgi:thiopurine S-methyltransferase
MDEAYWSNRYIEGQTGWNIGYPSTPLKEYIDQLTGKTIRILVPGAGNAYEVEYLWHQGFVNTFLLDISPEPIEEFKRRVPDFPSEQLLHEDFFLHEDRYDLILEQTFFSAIDPALRPAYGKKMYELLSPGGKLAGVLFDAPMNTDKPPFGGTKAEYSSYFEPYFTFRVFDACYNSIAPRAGTELFILLERKAG